MAMTKKEQAVLDQAREEARINRALRWSDPAPLPDVEPPSIGMMGDVVRGWLPARAWKNALPAVATVSAYGINTDTPNVRGRVKLFSTKRAALHALRATLEREFAEQLAAIDALIAQEREQNNGEG